MLNVGFCNMSVTGADMLGTHPLDLLSLSNPEIASIGNTSNAAYIRFYEGNSPVTNGYLMGMCNQVFTFLKDRGTTRVGIGTTNVATGGNLHVQGTIVTSNIDTYNTNRTIQFAGNNLGGVSNISFSGTLFQGNEPFKTSQWNSLSNGDIVFPSNVGIGTSSPQGSNLWVQGDVLVTGTLRADIVMETNPSVGMFTAVDMYPSPGFRSIQTNDVSMLNRVLYTMTLRPGRYLVNAGIPFKNLTPFVTIDTLNWVTVDLYATAPASLTAQMMPVRSHTVHGIGSANSADVDMINVQWFLDVYSQTTYSIVMNGKGHLLNIGPHNDLDTRAYLIPIRGLGVDDSLDVRQALAANPGRAQYTVLVPSSIFDVSIPGNYTVDASHVDVFVNGSKLNGNAYGVTTNFNPTLNPPATVVTVQLQTPPQPGDVVQLTAWPMVTADTLYSSGYLYQRFGDVYSTPWQNVVGGGARLTDRCVIDGDLYVGGSIFGGCNTGAFASGTFVMGELGLNSLSNAIGTTNLADGAVTSDKLLDNAVVASKIANNAVTTAKIADGAIGTTKIAASSITTATLSNNAVTNLKIADGAVGTTKIVDGAVTAAKLNLVSGNVGIGTTNPQARFHVHSDTALVSTYTPWASYRQQTFGSTPTLMLPHAPGTINGVNITALNDRTRTSRATATAAVSTWTTRTSAADNSWTSVCWAPELSLFVAVGGTGTGNRVMTSNDGINWTSRTSAADNFWTSVCWAPELSLFVAVAATGTGNRVMTSNDGITWVTRTSAADNFWTSVCWAPELSLFVAVAATGLGNRVMTSNDGITWVTRTSAADNEWFSVCWAPELSLFVAVSRNGTGNSVMTSNDGITWTTRTSAADNFWTSVCWAPELSLFVAVGSGVANGVMTSNDGITWVARTSAGNNTRNSVCWSPELSIFVAVSNSGIRVMTSNDGITWVARTSPPFSIVWSSVCWSPELSIFVAVSNSGTGNSVMTSDIGMPNSQSAVLANPAHVTVNQQGNVGVGITNPLARLHILHPTASTGDIFRVDDQNAPDTTPFVIKQDGNVGIGLTNPSSTLHVAGPININTENESWFQGSDAYIYINALGSANGYGRIGVWSSSGAKPLSLNPGGGNVGIGTNNVQSALHIHGLSGSGIRLSGTEFHQPASSSDIGNGIVMFMGVNRTDNRQLWIGSSESLTVNSTNACLRIRPQASLINIDGIATDGITQLPINFIGRVGMGLTNPDTQLHVGGQTIISTINKTYALNLFPDSTNQCVQIEGVNQANNTLETKRNIAMQVYGGNVGIGTTNPLARLHTRGSIMVQGANTSSPFQAMVLDNNGASTNNQSRIYCYGPTGTRGRFHVILAWGGDQQSQITALSCISTGTVQLNAYTTNGTVTTTNGTGSLSVSSDQRLKTNIDYLEHGGNVDKVLALKPAMYELKTDPGTKYLGFIAQDVETVIPEAVDGKKYEYEMVRDSDGNVVTDVDGKPVLDMERPRYRGLSYNAIVATAVAAIQELAIEIDSLKEEKTALKTQISDMQARLLRLEALLQ
jgi:hypothetical protein